MRRERLAVEFMLAPSPFERERLAVEFMLARYRRLCSERAAAENEDWRPGRRNGGKYSQKLTPQQRAEIAAADATIAELARRYGISHTWAAEIRAGYGRATQRGAKQGRRRGIYSYARVAGKSKP